MKQVPLRFRLDQLAAIDEIHQVTRIPRQVLIREGVDLLIANYKSNQTGRGKRQRENVRTTAATGPQAASINL